MAMDNSGSAGWDFFFSRKQMTNDAPVVWDVGTGIVEERSTGHCGTVGWDFVPGEPLSPEQKRLRFGTYADYESWKAGRK